MKIQHNIMAMNAYRNLGMNNSKLSKNLEKLSSGYRINRAGDDAAGLAISEKMRSQIAGLEQAQKNAQSGINLIQTAEGALTEVHDMLNRMVTLSTQAANGTYSGTDQEKIQSEIDALTKEIDRIAEHSNFNGTKLLDGTLGGYKATANDAASAAEVTSAGIVLAGGKLASGDGITLTHGTDGSIALKDITVAGNTYAEADLTSKGIAYEIVAPEDGGNGTYTVNITVDDPAVALDADANAIGNGLTATITTVGAPAANADYAFTTDGTGDGLQLQIGSSSAETIKVNVDSMSAESLGIDTLNVGTVPNANESIDKINAAIEKVSVQRSNLGAYQNRLEHTINNLGVMEENIQDAESNIRDTDIADEMMAYTKNNILIQSAQAMLAQANQVPQGVLQLMQ